MTTADYRDNEASTTRKAGRQPWIDSECLKVVDGPR